jgi:GNAT superfamily N-acetyltransferase
LTAPSGPGRFLIEPLGKGHDRTRFSCGEESIDRYLRTQASQDIRRKANAVFVMVDTSEPGHVIGYFTLCATALNPGAVPEAALRHIPRYPLVSATLIGRLAVDKSSQGRGLGATLLANALRRAYENAAIIGCSMVVVDAIDDRAVRFYEAHGFIRLADSMRLILPMAAIATFVKDDADHR